MWKGGVRIRDGEGERERQRGGGKTRMRVRKVGKSEKRKGGGRAVRALRRDGVQCPKAAAWTPSPSMREMPLSKPAPSLLGNTAAAS